MDGNELKEGLFFSANISAFHFTYEDDLGEESNLSYYQKLRFSLGKFETVALLRQNNVQSIILASLENQKFEYIPSNQGISSAEQLSGSIVLASSTNDSFVFEDIGKNRNLLELTCLIDSREREQEIFLNIGQINFAFESNILGNLASMADRLNPLHYFDHYARLGDADAQFELGNFYRFGIAGFNIDRVEAAKWYLKSAEVGHIKANIRLGDIHFEDNNFTEAFRLYSFCVEEAADSEAQFKLAKCLEKGLGTLQNLPLAFENYSACADAGYSDSQKYLGDCYRNGYCGLDRNVDKAIDLYRLSAQQGNKFAIDELHSLGINFEQSITNCVRININDINDDNLDGFDISFYFMENRRPYFSSTVKSLKFSAEIITKAFDNLDVQFAPKGDIPKIQISRAR